MIWQSNLRCLPLTASGPPDGSSASWHFPPSRIPWMVCGALCALLGGRQFNQLGWSLLPSHCCSLNRHFPPSNEWAHFLLLLLLSYIGKQHCKYPLLVHCSVHPSLWLNGVHDIVMWVTCTPHLSINPLTWNAFPDDESRKLDTTCCATKPNCASPGIPRDVSRHCPIPNLAQIPAWQRGEVNVCLINVQYLCATICLLTYITQSFIMCSWKRMFWALWVTTRCIMWCFFKKHKIRQRITSNPNASISGSARIWALTGIPHWWSSCRYGIIWSNRSAAVDGMQPWWQVTTVF